MDYSEGLPERESVDVRTDYLDFRNQVRAQYGIFYAQQMELFFDRAYEEYQRGFFMGAARHAEFALELGRLQEEMPLFHLICFLVHVYIILANHTQAMHYLQLAYTVLDPDDANYEEHRERLQELQDDINGIVN